MIEISHSWISYLEHLGVLVKKYSSISKESCWPKKDWDTLNEQLDKAGFPFPESLILIYPKWYTKNDSKNGVCPVRGPRTYQSGSGGICGSKEFWGYECTIDSKPNKDHTFPYGYGGPTDESHNFTWLCKIHNELKGSDFHMVDLRNKPEWFDGVLLRVSKQIKYH